MQSPTPHARNPGVNHRWWGVVLSTLLGLACGSAPPDEDPDSTPQDSASVVAPVPLVLPTLEYEHPYRRHAEAALAELSHAAGPRFQDQFRLKCEPKGKWCSVYTTQPDVASITAVATALRAAIHRERPGLGAVLYSARDIEGTISARFFLARPGQLEQEPQVAVAETSRSFADQVVRKARRVLPSYLAKNLHVTCASEICGASVVERSQATFDKVLAATQRACRSLQCEVLVFDQASNAAGMQRGTLSIQRYVVVP